MILRNLSPCLTTRMTRRRTRTAAEALGRDAQPRSRSRAGAWAHATGRGFTARVSGSRQRMGGRMGEPMPSPGRQVTWLLTAVFRDFSLVLPPARTRHVHNPRWGLRFRGVSWWRFGRFMRRWLPLALHVVGQSVCQRVCSGKPLFSCPFLEKRNVRNKNAVREMVNDVPIF